MPTYYVGAGGNNGNSGLTWALRKLTVNGAEDVPVVAGDIVYVGPGVYREMLTCDVSGGAGTEIVYIGDVTGEHTDGVGGYVRITGSNNDQTSARSVCIFGNGKDYRIFRGFTFDLSGAAGCHILARNSDYWTVEDSSCIGGFVFFQNDNTGFGHTLRRCVCLMAWNHYAFYFTNGATISNAGHLIENCFVNGSGLRDFRIGGITVRNCTITNGQYAIRVEQPLAIGQTVTVNNSILAGNQYTFHATAVGEITEDFNNVWEPFIAYTNTNVGANTISYSPLFLPPLLHSGEDQISGYKMPWWFGELSEWSQIRAITGSNEPAVDLRGIPRPTIASKNSWGPIQFHDAERDTTTVQGGSVASMKLNDAGVYQIWAPVDGTQITVSVYCYREANYAGVNPRMIIKQPGQADRTTTDVGAAGAWNQLTDTFTPAADPEWITIELQSLNTAVAGNYAAYFDTLELSASPDTGEFETWLWDREMADWVVTAGAGAVSITPLRGGLGGG